MKCPDCSSESISRRGKRYNKLGEKQLYICNFCRRKFVEQNSFERMRYKKDDILYAVQMYREGYSISQVQNDLRKNKIKVSREAIRRWIKKYLNF